ncbi:zinc finger protein AEBP2 isoform X2 [Sceloporus undulatus]|uniref:zinc finger protein AEBP2 isoform X2 n=1 Tax=Sceloporus undulatus TaxID=8520 RepID=UPI001C4C7E5B|nr:zinc finger protein AEBP2 isoform X2 [Sceloporus undulatus]
MAAEMSGVEELVPLLPSSFAEEEEEEVEAAEEAEAESEASSSSSSSSPAGMEAEAPAALIGEGAESMSEPSPESASQAGDGDDEEEEDGDDEDEDDEEAEAASSSSSSSGCCSDETRSLSPGGSEADAKEEAKAGPRAMGGPGGGEEEEEEEEEMMMMRGPAPGSGLGGAEGAAAAAEGEGEGGEGSEAGGSSSSSSSVCSGGGGSGGDEGYSTGGGSGGAAERGGGGGGRGGGGSTCSASSSSSSVGRRGSLEISSSDGEPLSRMDSEDSISSTIMDVDSTISSGRSTPVMMNGQGVTASSAKSIAYNCCWDQCHACFNSSPDLADHIRSIHVDGQRGGVFVCLWKGCKVYNTPSTSQSWLQRHMLTHSGDKPFKCVVGGCNASFASQSGLARHVPTHFSQQNSSKVTNQPKAKEESPSKAGMNKRRKLKNKRRRSLPRPHDFFDAQTLDAIRHRAICFNLSAHIESLGKGHSVVFHSTVIAKRKEDSGKIKLLLHWTPEDILPDVWVNESERHQLKTKVVHLSKLPKDTALLLDPNIYRTMPQKRLKR